MTFKYYFFEQSDWREIYFNVGVKPAPRTWMQWNLESLEPPNIKMREEIMNQSKQKKNGPSKCMVRKICEIFNLADLFLFMYVIV